MEIGPQFIVSPIRLEKPGIEPATPRPEVIKLFSCSAQLILKFILLINVKMPTKVSVGILTFISRINYCFMGFMLEFSTDFWLY